MKILFVCGADFSGPSEKQALGFAEQLELLGHEAAVAVRGGTDVEGQLGRAPVGARVLGYRLGQRGPDADFRAAVRAMEPDIVHAFNPRVPVMAAAEAAMQEAPDARLWVHFEDDEWGLSRAGGSSYPRRAARAVARTSAPLHPGAWHLATVSSLRTAGAKAAGFDALTPALAAEIRRRMGRGAHVVLPVLPWVPAAAGGGSGPGSEAVAGLAARTVAFTGGVHGANLPDFRLLLRAVAILRGAGHDVGLVHAGTIARRLSTTELCAAGGLDTTGARFLGPMPFTAMPSVLAAADVLAQPGGPSEFNRFRLPSKLQTYLAAGRPVVTFAVGFGELVEDGTEVLKTHTDRPEELAARIGDVLSDDELAGRLGTGGREAAQRLFDPRRNTQALLAAYQST